MEYPSYKEKSSSWHLTGGGTKVKVSCALLAAKQKAEPLLALTAYRLGSLGGKREKGDHFTLDVVVGSHEQKCGLKYDMQTFRRKVRTLDIKDI